MIDIADFCDKDSVQSKINQPFCWDGYIYATDARIVVRRHKVPEDNFKDGENVYNVKEMFDKIDKTGEFKVLPDFEVIDVECEECCGSGEIKICNECDSCGGTGECKCANCGGIHDCGVCDGEGEIISGGITCQTCNGTGKTKGCHNAEIEGYWFSGKYIWLLKKLGAVKYILTKLTPESDSKAMYFQSNDYEGILMSRTAP